MKAHGFRVCFTPLLEVLFTFPSRYLSTIGLSVVFSLTGWAPQIPAEFLVLRGTQVPSRLADIVSRTGLSPSTDQLSRWFRYSVRGGSPTVLQPRARPKDRPGLGSCAFARHYLRNHCYFLFLRVLRCFSSPRSPPRIARMAGSLPPGFPIRTSPGRCAFAAHRRFSQLVTSFVASESHRHPPCALRNFPCSSFRSLRHAYAPTQGERRTALDSLSLQCVLPAPVRRREVLAFPACQ